MPLTDYTIPRVPRYVLKSYKIINYILSFKIKVNNNKNISCTILTNVKDVGSELYEWYTKVLCLLDSDTNENSSDKEMFKRQAMRHIARDANTKNVSISRPIEYERVYTL